jgi:hypothetical protein
MKSKSLQLVGGKPQYDLTIIQPTRWGMGSATLMARDVAHDGMNIMYKIHERDDWVSAFLGREHHSNWCASVRHPDMQLIEAAPDLLEALEEIDEFAKNPDQLSRDHDGVLAKARAAIKKAKGAT